MFPDILRQFERIPTMDHVERLEQAGNFSIHSGGRGKKKSLMMLCSARRLLECVTRAAKASLYIVHAQKYANGRLCSH